MMQLDPQAIANHFGGEARGNQVNIPTPGHSKRDRGTSITLKSGAPDGLIVHCHNGDSSDALAVKDQLRKAGFLPEREQARAFRNDDLQPATVAQNHAVHLSPGQRIVATFDYIDADGHVRYRTHRVEPGREGTGKEFRYDRPSGGAWLPGIKDEPHLPYGFASVAMADRTANLFLVEGERKADKLVAWGLQALSLKNIDHWFQRFSSYFEGRRVIILPDNDDAGERYAAKAAELAGGTNANVSVLRLPSLPPGGDILDWDGGPDDLAKLTEMALLPLTQDDTAKPKITATPYQWCDPAAIPPRPWIFGRWLLRRTVAAVVAPGGVGKTTFIAAAALSMVTGRELLGKTVWDGPQRVWIWNLEDGLDDMQRSIQASATHHGVRREDVDGRLFIDCAMEGAGLCTAIEGPDGFKLLSPVYEQVTAEIIERGIDVLVIDPFVSSHEVEENANSLIDKVAKAWARVANDANCVVVLVHHTSKAGAGTVTAHSSRGAVALTDATRSALVLNRMDEKKAQELGFDDSEGKRYFSVGDDKHNRAPAEKADWFFLASVNLGNGPDGGDSIGVAQPAKLPDPFEDITVDDLRAVQSKVNGGDWRENNQANNWVGKAVAEVVGLDLGKSSDKAKVKALLRTWIANGALRVVERKDNRSELRKFIDVGSAA